MSSKNLYYDSTTGNLDYIPKENPSIATPSNVKSNYIFKDASTKESLIGTMPINQGLYLKINPLSAQFNDNIYVIPKGYHDGTGKVYTGNLSEYTKGTAAPDNVAFGKVFWVNGERQVGTLDIGQIDQPGTAKATDILSGKTAWVDKKQITGTIPVLSKVTKILAAGEFYNIPYGLTSGNSVISAKDLSSQTEGTAIQSDILSGKIAWVNGEKVTGTLNIEAEIKEKLAEAQVNQSQVLSGEKFYSAKYDEVVSGTMPDHTGEGPRELDPGVTYYIPEGYYDGQSPIITKSLSDSTVGTAKDTDLIESKIAWVNGKKITGTMPYNSESIVELYAGSSYKIPKGYHTGKGKVSARSIADQTAGTAINSDISFGKTAWVNGEKVIGTMQEITSESKELLPGESYNIPEGHHNGFGNIWTKSLQDSTKGTATQFDILSGKTAWVNGSKLTGNIPSNNPDIINLLSGDNYIIPEGYHTGSGKVKVASLASQTKGTADYTDIAKGQTAWVNGIKITGTLQLSGNADSSSVLNGYTFYSNNPKQKLIGSLSFDGSATDDDVISGKTFYSTNPKQKITGTLSLSAIAMPEQVLDGITFYKDDPKNKEIGTMPNIGKVIEEISSEQEYIIPKGYHDGTGVVKAIGLGPQTEGTADSSDIIKGQIAWVNGKKITGTLELSGNATEEFVLNGKTFYSDHPKQKRTGTIPVFSTQYQELLAGESYNILKGYHDGTSIISAKDLASQTTANATSSDILEGKTAWVNGSKISGTAQVQSIKLLRIAVGHNITLPAGVYPEGITIYAIYLDRLDLSGTDAYIIEDSLYPNNAGYADGDMLIITAELET